MPLTTSRHLARKIAKKAEKLDSASLAFFLPDSTVKGKQTSYNEILEKHGLTLSVARSSELPIDQKNAIFATLEHNMRTLYENSETGWDSKAKRDELFDPASRFLTIVKHRTTEHNTANAMPASMLMGFVMWRFDTEECMENDPCARVGEDEIAVAYCYELQVTPFLRGAGLGWVLMHALESIARGAAMQKCMLTVFLANSTALKFYKRIGYTRDLISPSCVLEVRRQERRKQASNEPVDQDEDSEDEYDYEIFSKRVS